MCTTYGSPSRRVSSKESEDRRLLLRRRRLMLREGFRAFGDGVSNELDPVAVAVLISDLARRFLDLVFASLGNGCSESNDLEPATAGPSLVRSS